MSCFVPCVLVTRVPTRFQNKAFYIVCLVLPVILWTTAFLITDQLSINSIGMGTEGYMENSARSQPGLHIGPSVHMVGIGTQGFYVVFTVCAPLLAVMIVSCCWHSNRKRREEFIREIEGGTDGLESLIGGGSILLLSSNWLLSRPSGWILSRRQDLPPEAFVSPNQAVTLLRKRRVVVLSYKWLARGPREEHHPDPDQHVHLFDIPQSSGKLFQPICSWTTLTTSERIRRASDDR
jgi:hypothetical protein